MQAYSFGRVGQEEVMNMREAVYVTESNAMAIDEVAHVITGANGSVRLTPREYSLLTCLVSHKGAPVSRSELLRDAWDWEYASELKTKTVDMHVRRLRVKLERAGFNPQIIATVRGRGYSFNA